MKKRKKEKKRHGCLTFILILLIFAVGFYAGNRSDAELPDGGLPDLVREYASRGVDAVKEKLGGFLVKDGEEDGFFASWFKEKEEEPVEFAGIEGADHTVNRILYEELSEDGKYIYRALYNAAVSHEKKVYIPTVDEEELKQIHSALKYDNPQLPCLGDEFSYGSLGPVSFVKLNYIYTEEACREVTAKMLEKAKDICKECAGKDEFGRELYIHDALLSSSVYSDEKNSAHCAAGTLTEGEGVCASYALAMKLMLDISGIRSCIIQGEAENGEGVQPHVWLAVNIDGAWYHTDPTWDDPSVNGDKHTLIHTYFDLPTERISADHRDFTLPDGIVCEDENANYFVRMGLMCRENDWRTVVSNAVYECLDDKGGDVEFMFESPELFADASAELNDGGFGKTVQNAVFGKGLAASSWIISTQTFDRLDALHYVITLK